MFSIDIFHSTRSANAVEKSAAFEALWFDLIPRAVRSTGPRLYYRNGRHSPLDY